MNIVGVDEAGRGALFGNVLAAAVILPDSYDINKTVDSKSISEEKRKKFANYIKAIAIDYAFGIATYKEIDEFNIHNATLLAMQRAIAGIEHDYDEIWVDGKFTPDNSHKPIKAFVKGDKLHDCIAAASILAKTMRDSELCDLDKLYPQYGFAKHKGYPTQLHKIAIAKYGILPEHRRSYNIKIQPKYNRKSNT